MQRSYLSRPSGGFFIPIPMPDLQATIAASITGYVAGCAVPIEVYVSVIFPDWQLSGLVIESIRTSRGGGEVYELYGPHADRTEEFGKSVGVDIMKACRDEARHWFRYNAT